MMLKTLVLALFVAAVSASPLLGGEKCSWGPSYWCENIKQASECKAVEHCRTKVWSMKVQAACDVCEEVVDKLRDFLSQNSTETEIIQFLEQLCDQVAGPLAPMCKQAVEQYGPEILKNLIALMQDSKQVCTALGLCAAKDKKTIVAELIMKSLPVKQQLSAFLAPGPVITKPKTVTASAQCILCEYVMSTLDNLLKENATQQEIEEALDKVCSYLPSTISAECTEFVNEYAPAILAILAQELDPSMVCTALGLCASEKNHKASEKLVTFAPQSNETCEICQVVMTYVKQVLSDNATQQEILKLLEEFCNELPSQIASECSAIVSEYGQAILSILATADPKTLCTEIGLCTSAAEKQGNYCFLGASYWCANKANALKCNAFKHCTNHVWK